MLSPHLRRRGDETTQVSHHRGIADVSRCGGGCLFRLAGLDGMVRRPLELAGFWFLLAALGATSLANVWAQVVPVQDFWLAAETPTVSKSRCQFQYKCKDKLMFDSIDDLAGKLASHRLLHRPGDDPGGVSRGQTAEAASARRASRSVAKRN